jgi:hypothetical protein
VKRGRKIKVTTKEEIFLRKMKCRYKLAGKYIPKHFAAGRRRCFKATVSALGAYLAGVGISNERKSRNEYNKKDYK